MEMERSTRVRLFHSGSSHPQHSILQNINTWHPVIPVNAGDNKDISSVEGKTVYFQYRKDDPFSYDETQQETNEGEPGENPGAVGISKAEPLKRMPVTGILQIILSLTSTRFSCMRMA